MTGIQRHIKASLGLLLLTGLVAGCATTPPWAPRTAEVIPAQVCSNTDSDGDGVLECSDQCPGSTRGQDIGPDGCPIPPPVVERPFRG